MGKLVIVESPSKAKTIKKYLGGDYEVIASQGHIVDLPANKLAVDVDNDFKPEYKTMPDKAKLIKDIKEQAKDKEIVYLATDPDREGEAIAWHLKNLLKIKDDKKCRIEFNEITKNAVSKWERGLSLMDISLLKPLCEELGVSITELLNGERIDNNNIQIKSDEVIKNTLDYSNKKIKKSRIKNIIYTVLTIVILFSLIFFGYKFSLLNDYTYKKPDNVDEILKGLKNSKEISVYKRTIPENEYFVLGSFKMKNVLEGYEQEGEVLDIQPYVYKKTDGDKKYAVSFGNENNNYQLIDLYTMDMVVGDVSDIGTTFEEKFNAADRKYFLLKNDINNDVDFYKYITNNYYKDNNIFMNKREMMENYSFNTFVALSIPQIDSITYIKSWN